MPIRPIVFFCLIPFIVFFLHILAYSSDSHRTDSSKKNNKISVILTGIKSTKGSVRLALFDQAKGFPLIAKSALALAEVPAQKGTVKIVLGPVASGKFALVAFHDLNDNNKLDVNLFGIPVEPYGASNNARGIMSAPQFDDAKFSHGDSLTTVSFVLK
jgi:uncharacterized protein (DUF2141 family)